MHYTQIIIQIWKANTQNEMPNIQIFFLYYNVYGFMAETLLIEKFIMQAKNVCASV